MIPPAIARVIGRKQPGAFGHTADNGGHKGLGAHLHVIICLATRAIRFDLSM